MFPIVVQPIYSHLADVKWWLGLVYQGASYEVLIFGFLVAD